MNKLLNRTMKKTIDLITLARNSSEPGKDDIDDLIMFIDSKGKCEVDWEEAGILIRAIKRRLEVCYKDLKKAQSWLEAIEEDTQ